MQHYIGKNDFEGCFDFYKWSAPFFDTPKDVVRYVNSLKLSGKILKHINVIGCGYNVGCTNNGLPYQKLKEAGLEPELDENDEACYNWYRDYPYKDRILVPRSVELCEPIQFVFEDETTVEILPTRSGGARIGVNSIPTSISDGLNRSDFYADIFFKEIIGKSVASIEPFIMCVAESGKQYINANSLDIEEPYIEKRHEYEYIFSFEYPYQMKLSQKWQSWYTAKLEGSAFDANVPYARVQAAIIDYADEQIMITNGRGQGGTFWILPISLDGNAKETEWLMDGYGISIDDYYVGEFLLEFLLRFFDPDIQEREEYEEKVFDDYGVNFYSFDAIRGMIKEIRAACWLLENDYDNPALTDIKSHFQWYSYTNKRMDELTESEINELRKNRVPTAVDLYNRLCTRLEEMMLLPGKDAISFEGP